MKKIVTVVGARPQFIKVAPVSRVLRQEYHEIIINTGQHYDSNMADVFFQQLNIPLPDYNLGVGSATHGKQTGQMLQKIESLLNDEKPEAVLVYGDTNSTLAGALAASKMHIPIIHVEAGLRSYNKKMPEETNRVLTDHISTLLFAPTDTAVSNLSKEGIVDGVYQVGDVMYDAMIYNIELAQQHYKVQDFGLKSKQYYLSTIHRAENTDNRDVLKNILLALSTLNVDVILPLHPRTRAKMIEYGLGDILESSNLRVIEPISYLEMIFLEKNAKGIITDSGGVQKEAYFLQVPCYTLRTETEWVETVNCGWNQLLPPDTPDLAHAISKEFDRPYIPNLFGEGRASQKIVSNIHTLW
ncbi:UDP-N-acetylglucosamine 2-epimerase (non-hydrolyzing) [Cohnella sp. CIP 111063]|uniref:non-hydrolyzing UDP-N-acetylglucosamine 2-epimerase n=1 Tax=unclassified Cohnella TaxID=2636738 RepID=UPI000B8C0174|nr:MULTISPECIES: UDP-N-acetylglucosamine 2-epimerase (non-hydrolyzing) [unclassified Cohnella]OXS55929.1 UDP-N-acetylglucosamine 2-epimerase (non-hydrolyzing) [Cohnella sp. CIP 111063]PRX67133.1 UDP-GlcNAc3NAcA epimerase [Cohnella sp. SGD-V74]